MWYHAICFCWVNCTCRSRCTVSLHIFTLIQRKDGRFTGQAAQMFINSFWQLERLECSLINVPGLRKCRLRVSLLLKACWPRNAVINVFPGEEKACGMQEVNAFLIEKASDCLYKICWFPSKTLFCYQWCWRNVVLLCAKQVESGKFLVKNPTFSLLWILCFASKNILTRAKRGGF